MNKKILISSLVLIAAVIVLVYMGFLRPGEEVSWNKTYKSFRSRLEPTNLEEMNIILLTIDTLRADHLECYGYDGVKTPHINRMSREGVRFENNIVQAPLTLPSHASIMTGTYPLFHGIRDNGGFYLDEKHNTLAEVLRFKGYKTSAFIAAFVLDSRWGLDQGFDTYYDNFDLTKYKRVSLDSVQRRGDEVLTEAYKWLEKHAGTKFFTWIHLYDPHTPYDPPEPFKSQYSTGRFRLYDGEIAYVDQLMGEFLDFLEKKELLEKTLVIFTADHGESLGEHKESAHGFFIYDSDIRVPLILRFPNKVFAGGVITEQVKSIDIMPTVLHSVNLETPEAIQGETILPLILGEESRVERSAYSETYWPNYHYGWSELKSIRKGQYKFIDAPKPELYDVRADPGEIRNLVNQRASMGLDMKRELDVLIQEYSAEGIEDIGPQKLDNDSLIKLQALGYIGSFHSSRKPEEGKLADPKDRIELYNEIKLAQFMFSEEKMEKAEIKINEVLRKDPSVLEARYILGNIYSKQEKYDQAIDEYQQALAVNPEYYEAIFGLALVYKKSKRLEDAIVGFQRLIEIDPRDTKPFLHLGDIYDELGELDKTLQHLKAATEIDPEAPVFHNKLGAAYLKKEMYTEAEREITLALSFERSIPLLNAHFNMALLHEARGQIDLAIQEYRKEQEVSPYNYKPDFNLGLLYAKMKNLESASTEFERCIEKNEDFAEAYVFLAKAYMDSHRDLNQAESLAQRGLDLKPDQRTTILAHYVLADIYNRLRQYEKYQHHVEAAKQLQKTLPPQ